MIEVLLRRGVLSIFRDPRTDPPVLVTVEHEPEYIHLWNTNAHANCGATDLVHSECHDPELWPFTGGWPSHWAALKCNACPMCGRPLCPECARLAEQARQRAARPYRARPDDAAIIFDVVTPLTVDDGIRAVLRRKKALIRALLGRHT